MSSHYNWDTLNQENFERYHKGRAFWAPLFKALQSEIDFDAAQGALDECRRQVLHPPLVAPIKQPEVNWPAPGKPEVSGG